MIKIKNEEYYYSLPGHDPMLYQQHTPLNMVYRTLQFMPQTFYERDLRKKIEDMWGVKKRRGVFGVILTDMENIGYVKIVKEKTKHSASKINRYTVLPKYYRSIR